MRAAVHGTWVSVVKVGEVLEHKSGGVVTVRPRMSVAAAAGVLAKHGVGAAVISGDGRRIDGIFTERDLVHGVARDGEAYLAREVQDAALHKVYTCSPDDDLERVIMSMKRGRIRHMPVARHGVLVGLISLVDVLREHLAKVGIA